MEAVDGPGTTADCVEEERRVALCRVLSSESPCITVGVEFFFPLRGSIQEGPRGERGEQKETERLACEAFVRPSVARVTTVLPNCWWNSCGGRPHRVLLPDDFKTPPNLCS